MKFLPAILLLVGALAHRQPGVYHADRQIEWLREHGGFFSEKIQFQRLNTSNTDSPMGIFAVEDIGEEETIMVKIPRAPKVYKHGCDCIFEDIVFHIKDAYSLPRFHIYGLEEDKEKLSSLWSKINTKKIQILLLTEKNKKIVENLELHNFINVNSLKDKLDCVATYITAYHIEKKLNEYDDICDRKQIIKKYLDSKFGKDLEDLIDFQQANATLIGLLY